VYKKSKTQYLVLLFNPKSFLNSFQLLVSRQRVPLPMVFAHQFTTTDLHTVIILLRNKPRQVHIASGNTEIRCKIHVWL